ncbi:MAG: hypothetical protein AB8W32_13395 [Arsenophonus endosymbiont of Dermacentor nuttalli]
MIGLNGGGKSTLMNLSSGLYTPSHVDLKIDEVHLPRLRTKSLPLISR